jgi:hypothetical protein
MGAMTTAQIGRYSKGWMRRKAKKNNRPDFEAVKNSHIEQAKHDMNLMFCEGSGGGSSKPFDELEHAKGVLAARSLVGTRGKYV